MKQFILFSILLPVGLFSCKQSFTSSQTLQHRIDSLQTQLSVAYKPGLGEFMLGIQVHHAKLWFAGKNENWKLADFEIKEIQEALDDIKLYCAERPETKEITIIDPAIDSLQKSIGQQDPVSFKSGFITLTNSCNNCHRQNNHEYNVITIPSNPPFGNQDFTVQKK